MYDRTVYTVISHEDWIKHGGRTCPIIGTGAVPESGQAPVPISISTSPDLPSPPVPDSGHSSVRSSVKNSTVKTVNGVPPGVHPGKKIEDRSELIELIARTYPGNKTLHGLTIPQIMVTAIGDAVKAHGDKVLAGTKAYAAVVAKFPPYKRQFLLAADKWFRLGRYNEDPAVWVEVKPGEAPVNRFPLQSGLDAHERTMRDLLEAD
jgi:hypothetical protein